MKKKSKIPTNIPKAGREIGHAQRPAKNIRDDIMSKTTDSFNTNNGPKQRSRKKAF